VNIDDMSFSVSQAVSDAERALGRELRHAVFVAEQGVPVDVEIDGLDEVCQHFLVRSGEDAVATARARATERGWKLERVAVAQPYRRRAVGRLLVQRMLADAPAGSVVYVHAQESALGFWERLGFVADGPRFVEGGIGHRRMSWRRPATPP
jgi:predicted GNAT family N-acyltransferase